MAVVTQGATMLLLQSPVYIAWLVGVVLAIVRWRRHPGVSLLAILGLAVLCINSILGIGASVAVPLLYDEWGLAISQLGFLYGAIGIVESLIAAIGWGLIVAAIFRGRPAVPAIGKDGWTPSS